MRMLRTKLTIALATVVLTSSLLFPGLALAGEPKDCQDKCTGGGGGGGGGGAAACIQIALVGGNECQGGGGGGGG